VISDVHSNRQALESVLAAVDEAAVDEVWCLGDMVGYGADPDVCTRLIRERCDVCLVGNHDLAVLGALDISAFSEAAAVAVEWTRERADEETLEFLGGLEPSGERQGFALFHASPRDPIWEYVLSGLTAELCFDVTDFRVSFIGHSHVALSFDRQEGRPASGTTRKEGTTLEISVGEWLINPGSTGQPRDGDPRAAWLWLDTEARTVTWRRAEYDIAGAQAAIRAARLPDSLAERLQYGL
jgi:diadenosine tetraphosphatase ApaH/serine/threonine PP2A family protein phosphatase